MIKIRILICSVLLVQIRFQIIDPLSIESTLDRDSSDYWSESSKTDYWITYPLPSIGKGTEIIKDYESSYGGSDSLVRSKLPSPLIRRAMQLANPIVALFSYRSLLCIETLCESSKNWSWNEVSSPELTATAL